MIKLSINLLYFISAITFAEECFNAGKAKSIPEFKTLHQTHEDYIGYTTYSTPTDDGTLNYGDNAKVLDIKTGEIKDFGKKISDASFISEDGKLITYNANMYNDIHQTDQTGIKKIDGQKYLNAMKSSRLTVIDLKTNQKKELIGRDFFSNGKLYTPEKIINANGSEIAIGKDEDGKEVSMILTPGSNSFYFNSEFNRDIQIDDSNNIKVYEGNRLISQQKISSKLYNLNFPKTPYPLPAGPTPSGRYIFIPVSEEKPEMPQIGTGIGMNALSQPKKDTGPVKYLKIDIRSNSQRIINIPKNYTFFPDYKKSISPAEDKILVYNDTISAVNILDIATGEIKKIFNEKLFQMSFQKDGNICGISYDNPPQSLMYGSGGFGMGMGVGMNPMKMQNSTLKKEPQSERIFYKCLTQSGQVISSQEIAKGPNVVVSSLGNNKFIISSAPLMSLDSLVPSSPKKSYLVSPQNVCTKSISYEDYDCNPMPTYASNIEALSTIEVDLLCKTNFDPKGWSRILPSPITKLNNHMAILWLKKISKPNAFNAKTDLSVLKTLIESNIHKKYPSEFKAAMEGVLFESPLLHDDLIEKYPSIAIINQVKTQHNCLTESETVLINNKKREILDYKFSNAHFSQEKLDPLLEIAKNSLTKEQKISLANDLADSVVEKMRESPDLAGIFPSKIYKFADNHFKKKLGLDFKNLTDITSSRTNGTLNLIQLGVTPFEGSKESLGAIHLKLLSTTIESQISKTNTSDFKWDYDGNNYSARINVTAIRPKNDITPNNKSPDYEAMKKDNAFRGLIAVGTNMGKTSTENVIQQYLQYYAGQGFEFKPATPMKDAQSFLESRISGKDRAHYFVKEAHSDGDEKNLFRINKEGKVLRGVKKDKNGKEEIIEILYPGENPESTLISNTQFGEWMRQREKEKGPELVYLNSSCWSNSKAIYEIPTAKTSKLINIPTITTMVTFVNSPKSVMYAAVDGLRKHKTYQEIREAMMIDPTYKDGTSNTMIFPDEERYNTHLRSYLKFPIDIDTKIFIKKGNVQVPYSIEE